MVQRGRIYMSSVVGTCLLGGIYTSLAFKGVKNIKKHSKFEISSFKKKVKNNFISCKLKVLV